MTTTLNIVEKIKNVLLPKKKSTGMYNNNWKPAPHTMFRDAKLSKIIDETGYSIQKITDVKILPELRALYDEMHNMKSDNGGMFYSIYSQDTQYRQYIHRKIMEIIQPLVDTFCVDYKVMLNSYVIKLSGPESELNLHQDTTGVDEWKFSPISFWLPLHDVNEENGCLGIIPHSQHFFSPYRSISFPTPFEHIQNTAKKYLIPIKMKAGELLIFDNRVLHNSYPNNSGKTRLALISGLIPKDAKLVTCHKPEYKCGGKVELIEHDDNYLLTGKNFLIDCQKRPDAGKSLGWLDDPYLPISSEEFERLCSNARVKKQKEKIEEAAISCHMISEPM